MGLRKDPAPPPGQHPGPRLDDGAPAEDSRDPGFSPLTIWLASFVLVVAVSWLWTIGIEHVFTGLGFLHGR